jgi:hypothetical protein
VPPLHLGDDAVEEPIPDQGMIAQGGGNIL